MEPLDVLVEMIEDTKFESIAGPPQIIKIYPHINVLPFNVLWPRDNPTFISHFGRALLDYEGSRYACLDLRTKELVAPYEAVKRLSPSRANANELTAT
jgi:hypothetical protein